MSKRLLERGYSLVVHDRVAAARLTALGAVEADSPPSRKSPVPAKSRAA
jgi:3-hydroxyisobutyrate dehydrogenase-like beta-hydroxyacid dehydrogenase